MLFKVAKYSGSLMLILSFANSSLVASYASDQITQISSSAKVLGSFITLDPTKLPTDSTVQQMENLLIGSIQTWQNSINLIKTNINNLLAAFKQRATNKTALQQFVISNLKILSTDSKISGTGTNQQPKCLSKGCSNIPISGVDANGQTVSIPKTATSTCWPFCENCIDQGKILWLCQGFDFSWQDVYNAIVKAQPVTKVQLPAVSTKSITRAVLPRNANY